MRNIIAILFVVFGVRDSVASHQLNNMAQVALVDQMFGSVQQVHYQVGCKLRDNSSDLEDYISYGRSLRLAGTLLKQIQGVMECNSQLCYQKLGCLEFAHERHGSLIHIVSERAAKTIIDIAKADLDQKERQWLIELVRDLKIVAQTLPE